MFVYLRGLYNELTHVNRMTTGAHMNMLTCFLGLLSGIEFIILFFYFIKKPKTNKNKAINHQIGGPTKCWR